MAAQLMKIKVNVVTDLATTPTDTRFFYVTDEETEAGETLTINAEDFLDDTGSAVDELPELTTNNSYFNVFINGVLQMESICTYTPGESEVGKLEIDLPAGGDPILTSTPIILEIINFNPVSDNIITT
ncbi:MAG: DUF4183 domain-containing protein [Bacilli bacterium]|jgi:hypothetical protein